MKYKNYTAYDDEDFFERYRQKRGKGNAPNELIEQPIIDELIGDIRGKKVLDLGCGDGKYGLQLLKRGAQSYHGIEGSQRMAALAQETLSVPNAKVENGDIETTAFLPRAYDLVISRLVLHYVEDLAPLLEKINASLSEQGLFVFSIEHPIITSCYEAYHQKVKRGNWIVDNYFDSGERVNQWMGKSVIKYHRTLEEYWQLLRQAHMEILDIRESKPQPENFDNPEEYQRRMRIPLFLMIKARRIT